MRSEIKTKEVEVSCMWTTNDLKSLDKENVHIHISAKGDLPHHVIEGIVDCLKKIQPDNPHLR